MVRRKLRGDEDWLQASEDAEEKKKTKLNVDSEQHNI